MDLPTPVAVCNTGPDLAFNDLSSFEPSFFADCTSIIIPTADVPSSTLSISFTTDPTTMNDVETTVEVSSLRLPACQPRPPHTLAPMNRSATITTTLFRTEESTQTVTIEVTPEETVRFSTVTIEVTPATTSISPEGGPTYAEKALPGIATGVIVGLSIVIAAGVIVLCWNRWRKAKKGRRESGRRESVRFLEEGQESLLVGERQETTTRLPQDKLGILIADRHRTSTQSNSSGSSKPRSSQPALRITPFMSGSPAAAQSRRYSAYERTRASLGTAFNDSSTEYLLGESNNMADLGSVRDPRRSRSASGSEIARAPVPRAGISRGIGRFLQGRREGEGNGAGNGARRHELTELRKRLQRVEAELGQARGSETARQEDIDNQRETGQDRFQVSGVSEETGLPAYASQIASAISAGNPTSGPMSASCLPCAERTALASALRHPTMPTFVRMQPRCAHTSSALSTSSDLNVHFVAFSPPKGYDRLHQYLTRSYTLPHFKPLED
ncbi:hypothetical protein NP233_g1246 [Leucocoprinus birnbaumii]|uniref:Uncharacterized protein n=1 Tax=Leucocoprinus birnbaumii TaxID=56174 RepID=A0AAD5W0D5_9AGAR|nr:hypothetical protein NP233_g1246 [Leucocoprinus birnbaumii]